MNYKGHFRIQVKLFQKTLILHNNSKNLLIEEQQRKRGMFCVDEFPKDDLISFFGTVIFINCLFGSHCIHKC